MGESDRLSQFDKALIGLRSLVMGGTLKTSKRLPEVALAERLGLSRTPLRQAMDRLVAEGLLERIETGGCRVASFTIDDITDAIELRGVIEGTAARLAAERGADPALLDRGRPHVLDGLDGALDAPDRHRLSTPTSGSTPNSTICWPALPGSTVIQREAERVSRLPLASPSSFLQEQELIPDFRASLTPRAEPAPRHPCRDPRPRGQPRRGAGARTCAAGAREPRIPDQCRPRTGADKCPACRS